MTTKFIPRLRIAGLLVATLLVAQTAMADVPAFSGAEGWGAVTPGGRGGQVMRVTNLNDSGPGSFRAALEAAGPRTVVFDVAGQINLSSEVNITNPYLTIAGQTAPGGGITIAGETVSIDIHDVIVRHLRFRRGLVDEDRRDDGLGSDRTNSNDLSDPKTGNIIIDHVSASWGLDENLSIYRSKLDESLLPGGSTVLPTRNVTVQWSISSEALNEFGHAFGATWGGAGANFHHNLFASNTGRNPSISFSHFLDFRNNVSFNWQHRTADGAGEEAHVNMINNYLKPGPATNSGEIQYRIVKPEIRSGVAGPGAAGEWYVEGNFVVGYPDVTADNWDGGVQFELPMQDDWVRVEMPHTQVEFPDDQDDPFDDDGSIALGRGNPLPIPDLPTIATQSAQEAYLSVLAGAGASLVRDAVDLRIVDSVSTGTATAGPDGNGIIDHPDDVGGYPEIEFVTHPADWDTEDTGPGEPTGDGMPTWWELKHGLDPDAHDHNGDFDHDGYTNLEDYLNEIGAFPAVQDISWEGHQSNRYAQIENWDISFQPSRFDTAVIHSGLVEVDAVGQHAGTLKIGTAPEDDAQLSITAGWLEVAEEVVVGGDDAAATVLNQSGGRLYTPILNKGAAASYNFTGGTLHAGQIKFDLEVEGGTVAPGGSIGITTVEGNATFSSQSVLQIELAGDQSDRLVIQGDLDLGNDTALEIVQLSAPSTSSVLFAEYSGQLFGQFSAVTDGYTIDYDTPGQITLILAAPVLAGDYNDDGVVNAADYVVWRNSMLSGAPLDNETASPGSVDQADYEAWRDNFGAAADGQGQATSIPEPSSAAIVLIAFASFGTNRRGRWQAIIPVRDRVNGGSY